MYKLPIDRGTFLTLKPKDAKGNDVSLDNIDGETITATSSNPEIITVEFLAAPDQRIKVLPVGVLGTAQVNVSLTLPAIAPADPVVVTGLLEIETIAGGVVTFTLEPGGDFPL